MAAALARRTNDMRDLRHGQFSLALYNPPTRVAEEFAMLDVHLGRTPRGRFPGRHGDGHLLRLRPEPASCASATSRRMTWWSRPGHEHDTFAFNGRYTQQRYVNIGRARCSSRIRRSGSRRRLGRDLAVVRQDGLRLLLPVLLRLQGRPGDHGRFLGRDGPARQGQQPVPRRLPPVRRRRGDRAQAMELYTEPPSTSSTAACMSTRASPRPPATAPRRRSAPA